MANGYGSEGERLIDKTRWDGRTERRATLRNGNGSSWDYRGWGKVILELAILLIGMAFWFSLEKRVDRTIEWMVHHIERA